jgi:PTH1 family peptidyl-tRNA hydrolase
MKLVVGLGNPGEKYRFTRHNIGFLTLDLYLDRLGRRAKLKTDYGLAALVPTAQGERWFFKPQTFMNVSGEAVASFAEKKKILPQEMLVLHDEADLEPGRLQLKKGGGSSGHNGLNSIFDIWGQQDFWRLRIGVGKDPNKALADYVLEEVPESELRVLSEVAADALETILELGPMKAMNRINGRRSEETSP